MFTKVCHYCQKGKQGLRGYGKIPLKEVETQPWKDLCVDLSGPWAATINEKEMEFHALTMIDPLRHGRKLFPYTQNKLLIYVTQYCNNGYDDIQDHRGLFLTKAENSIMRGCMHYVRGGISSPNR